MRTATTATVVRTGVARREEKAATKRVAGVQWKRRQRRRAVRWEGN